MRWRKFLTTEICWCSDRSWPCWELLGPCGTGWVETRPWKVVPRRIHHLRAEKTNFPNVYKRQIVICPSIAPPRSQPRTVISVSLQYLITRDVAARETKEPFLALKMDELVFLSDSFKVSDSFWENVKATQTLFIAVMSEKLWTSSSLLLLKQSSQTLCS